MGLHLVAVAMAKLHLLSRSHSFTTPSVAALIGPFVLKVSFRMSFLRRLYIDAFDASRLFFFQLSQIALGAEQPAPDNGGHRWQRALRLVCQRITHVRRSTVAESEEDSFHTFSMLSL
ncbi:hypothetical protein HRI_003709400 [Hibiscus trionum]|uniref:Uncharacterized protein n=1 Tax=Hibiscus trionum TaxID=183268 RepID=A0A9W7MH81_HIBTR|nr:hypothetical protein HRI_003709400 [Hibiscus trionum]